MKVLKKFKKNRLKELGSIGKNCAIFEDVDLGSEPYLIFIGDNVKMSHGVKLINHDGGVHVLRNINKKNEKIDMFGAIIIKNNVFIGMNSIIMPGVTIGNNVIVGAGSIVTKSIPDNSVVAGVPAKVISTVSEYEEKRKSMFIETKLMDAKDKKKYILENYNKFPDKFLKR